MKVQRTEIYDFTIILTENEFSEIARIAEKLHLNMEQTVAELMAMGLTDLRTVLTEKERKNVLDG